MALGSDAEGAHSEVDVDVVFRVSFNDLEEDVF